MSVSFTCIFTEKVDGVGVFGDCVLILLFIFNKVLLNSSCLLVNS